MGVGRMEDLSLHHHRQDLSQPVRRVPHQRRESTCLTRILRGVPDERPIADLPIQRPDFKLLFGSDPNPGYVPTSMGDAEKGGEGLTRKRTNRGGEDIEITDKLTMTWVCDISASQGKRMRH